jgi:hypothetical protein
MMKIRRAKPEDVPALVEMGARFLDNKDYRGLLTFNPQYVEELMLRLGASSDSLLLVAERADGTLVGMIAFVVYPHPISRERVGGEVFWWAEQRGAAGLKLLRAAEMWAISQGAQVLQMIAPNERVEKLYEHLGYRKIETTYQRRL